MAAWGLLGAATIGIGAGLLSTVLTKLLYGLEDLFEHLPVHWMWWPLLSGIFVGVGGLLEPRALGVLHSGDVVSHAVDLMLATDQGRLTVTDPESGRLVGLITRKDLLQIRAALVQAEGERQVFFGRTRSPVA